jgi:hypothetical protein
MASSSQARSRADRKTHMLSVPSSSSRLEAGLWPPGADLRDFYRTALCISGAAGSQVGAPPGMSHCLRGATRSAAR